MNALAMFLKRVLFAMIAGVALGGPATAVSAAEEPITERQQAQPLNLGIALKDLSGKDVTLNSYKGKVIILNLWATWCRPCRKEIPDLIKLQAAHPTDLVVVGVVLQDKFGEKVKAFVREFGIPYPVLDGNDREDFEDAFGPFWGLPTSFVIDQTGRLHKKHQGQVTQQQLEREVSALLKN